MDGVLNLLNKIREAKNPLLVFNHGLGDQILFLPVFLELQIQLRKKITLGTQKKRQFKLIYPQIIYVDELFNVRDKYDFIYTIQYPDSKKLSVPMELHNESAKPYICAFYELGIKDFVWKPYKLHVKNNNKKIDKRIGVHLVGGHTGLQLKSCPNDNAELIWNEIIEAGYEPFEIYMTPKFSEEYRLTDKRCNDYLPFINKKNSLRFEQPDLQKMINEISKCKYFIGIDSGPIYLASTILGCENILGLYSYKRHDHFLPKHISMAKVENYKKNSIKRFLRYKDENN